ncbi:MAG: OsmC family protein [Spirochaetia bacterium]
MTVRLRRQNDAVHFVAENAHGNTVHVDGAEAIGGENAGFRPMQLLLAALGSCASMDVVPILKKQRQDVRDVQVRIDGERKPDATPSPFTSIHIHFTVYGNVDSAKAERAVSLAVEKYCSVAESLAENINLTHSCSVESETQAAQE